MILIYIDFHKEEQTDKDLNAVFAKQKARFSQKNPLGDATKRIIESIFDETY